MIVSRNATRFNTTKQTWLDWYISIQAEAIEPAPVRTGIPIARLPSQFMNKARKAARLKASYPSSADLESLGSKLSGDKKPSGPSLKLLNLIERKGLEAVL